MGHSFLSRSLQVCICFDSDGVKLGNWKRIWQWEVDQILLQSALELLNESDNQPEYIWFVVTFGTCYQMEDALVSCVLRHWARAANWEAQLDSCELRHLAHAANREACIQDLKWLLMSNRQMQQPTEMWKKTCRRQMKRCVFCLSRLMVAYPLRLSMMSLLNWFGLLKLDIYRKRLNPTWQSTKRADSRERYADRWETLLACQAQVCILRFCHAFVLIHEHCVGIH